MAEIRETYLMYVDGLGANSNKYYNMFPAGSSFNVEYGRMGSSKQTASYPISKWNSKYGEKVRKGYKDITDLKQTDTVVKQDSGNQIFDEFYNVFSKYTGDLVKKTYLAEGATKAQMEEAQHLLNLMVKLSDVDKINKSLLELYKVIPRRMDNVRNYLITEKAHLGQVIKREQDALDSMDSSNIMHVANPYKELGIDFKAATAKEIKQMEDLIYPTIGGSRCKIHKVFAVTHAKAQKEFDKWLKVQDDKSTQYLFHGTRNPNVFSILKSGLMVRPTSAVSFAGSAYGDGIYHSAHTAKSLNYTGYDNDKIFFIQNVHMGKPYTYSGWYRDGKDISRNQMNYKGVKALGCDSLYVKAGDGLLNSEYIVYNAEQTVTSFLVWMR